MSSIELESRVGGASVLSLGLQEEKPLDKRKVRLKKYKTCLKVVKDIAISVEKMNVWAFCTKRFLFLLTKENKEF